MSEDFYKVRKVIIEGAVPETIVRDCDEQLTAHFACFAAPNFGIRISYGEPFQHENTEMYYPFTIIGYEKVGEEYLVDIVKRLLDCNSIIELAWMKDCDKENGEVLKS